MIWLLVGSYQYDGGFGVLKAFNTENEAREYMDENYDDLIHGFDYVTLDWVESPQ